MDTRNILVPFKDYEIELVRFVAEQRNSKSVADGRKGKYGGADDGFKLHFLGACGELAVAKLTDRYWDGSVNVFDKSRPDVSHIHVRTRSHHYYELLVRDDDPDEGVFVLVTSENPPHDVTIRGWLNAGACKKSQWKQTHGGRTAAYFVPHEELNPVSSEMNRGRNASTP